MGWMGYLEKAEDSNILTSSTGCWQLAAELQLWGLGSEFFPALATGARVVDYPMRNRTKPTS